ncbi:leukocyte cell-derived chemotaxin-2-like [Centroberyx gerrardi]|uniref:leukocyte cell-derived chemotaxin-2-like n=1 Tax=Centroberyx gerrardi TaxID=166262 RepID=UPI003AAA94B5
MRAAGFLITALLAALIPVSAGLQFGQICSGNPTNSIRGWDTKGAGHYGAPRGAKTHKGVDVECEDGSTVYAPADLTITRRSRPYGNSVAIDNGISFTAGGICFKLWYIQPVKTSGTVQKGQRLGTMLNMQSVYPGITSHVHVERCDKADPTAIVSS